MNIHCTTCDAIMGKLEKANITDSDVLLYQQMMTCPNGHHSTDLVEPLPGEEEAIPVQPPEEIPPDDGPQPIGE